MVATEMVTYWLIEWIACILRDSPVPLTAPKISDQFSVKQNDWLVRKSFVEATDHQIV
jgi:hypothetical protein